MTLRQPFPLVTLDGNNRATRLYMLRYALEFRRQAFGDMQLFVLLLTLGAAFALPPWVVVIGWVLGQICEVTTYRTLVQLRRRWNGLTSDPEVGHAMLRRQYQFNALARGVPALIGVSCSTTEVSLVVLAVWSLLGLLGAPILGAVPRIASQVQKLSAALLFIGAVMHAMHSADAGALIRFAPLYMAMFATYSAKAISALIKRNLEGEISTRVELAKQKNKTVETLERLALERELVDVTFNGVDLGVVVLDDAGLILRSNDVAERLLGSPIDSNETRAALESCRYALADRNEWEAPGGRLLECSRSRVNESGERWTILIIRDITTMKQLELQKMQAQKVAAVGTFAAGISHEFNNLLMTIGGNAQLLSLKPAADSTSQRRLLSITDSVERASTITRSLLKLSTIELSKVEVASAQKVAALALAAVTQERPHDVTVSVAYETDALVSANLETVVLALRNLVCNAIDAVNLDRSNGASVSLEVYDDGTVVYFKVRDEGIGIATDQLVRVVEPFYTTKGPGEGVGLGLSIAVSVAENHGTRLQLESRLGEGTSAILPIPIASAKQKLLGSRQPSST